MKKHKKKRESKKHPSKKKKETKKKSNTWILLIVAVLIIILFLITLSNKKVQLGGEKKVLIEDLKFNKIPNSNRGQFSFYITNDHEEYADCSVTLFLDYDSFSWNVGIIKPNSRKLLEQPISMPKGTTKIKLTADCKWNKEIDISECENSTFKICNLIKEEPSLKQCLNRNIASQYFCIALIKNDAGYCDDIKVLYRKIHCIAFIENKPELCENLIRWRDWCYQDYAMNKQDKELCEKIKNEDKKKSCLGVTTSNVELCKDINERDKFPCIVNLAEFTGNKALCELLVDKEACYKDLEWMN